MSERKVLNKYFPPNFDPSKIPKQKKAPDQQHKVRLMAPFSMRCESCGEYIYKGKKFNARKETVIGEKYLAIQVFRFYIRCPRCSAELTFKTDPKNADYVAENGVTRNFGWQNGEQDDEDEDDGEDAMVELENRTLESRREMEIMDALDEIRTTSSRNERINVDDVLDRLSADARAQVEAQLNEEETVLDQEVQAIFKSADGETVRKLTTGKTPVDAITLVRQRQQEQQPIFKKPTDTNKRKQTSNALGIVVKKKQKIEPIPSSKTAAPTKPATNGLSLVAAYDDDGSESD
ncbi:DUF572-domain-containing protein [Hesseltinella vesiculosa]|uniref:Splicing factor YJU2 n=1 Tax=Hesseltinella vesiculosa TaxID=101127 RepID=A0A1X2G3Z2_9FUNG|nr:DUF572-domain-containing protein [Hesseltinella vesiculosa]